MQSKNKERKKEFKKLMKLTEVQLNVIQLLGHYYFLTDENNREIEKEMFPNEEPVPCECCGDDVYPIHVVLSQIRHIHENFEKLDIEDIDIWEEKNSDSQEYEESTQSLLN